MKSAITTTYSALTSLKTSMLLGICACVFLNGCSDNALESTNHLTDKNKEMAEATANADQTLLAVEIEDQLWSFSLNHLQLIHSKLIQLDSAVNTLFAVQNSSQKQLADAQLAWQNLSIQIQHLNLQLSIIHYLSDYSETATTLSQLAYRVSLKPITPGFIDSYSIYPHSGIVNDISLPLTSENLLNQHGATANEEVLLGVYAIEFLLFGEYLDQRPNRSYEDFIARKTLSKKEIEYGYQAIEELNENRRRTLLQLQLAQLKQDISTISNLLPQLKQKQWEPLPNTQKAFIVEKQLIQSATHLLTALAEFNHQQRSLYEGVTTPAERNLSETQQAIWITHYLESLESGIGFLIDVKKAKWRTKMDACKTSLEQIDDENKEDNKKIWQQVYENIKALLTTEAVPLKLDSNQKSNENQTATPSKEASKDK